MKKVSIVLAIVLVLAMCFALVACDGEEKVDTISNLKYNGEQISWDSVTYANEYRITINGEEFIVPQTKGRVAYDYNSNGEGFDFTIEAKVHKNSKKNPSCAMHFENIGSVENIKVASNELKWDALTTADTYEVLYNGEIKSVKTPTFVIPAGEFSCKVRGVKGRVESENGNNPYFSLWSDTFTGEVLDAPKNLKYDSEVFEWEKVTGATSYVVKIGNDEFTTDNNKYEYIAGTKDFDVSVRAVGNAENKVYDSVFTEPMTYKYIAPIEGLNVVDGNIKWTASTNAVRYKIKINGIVENELLTTNEYNKITSGSSYRIQILPMGDSDFWFSRWSEEMTVNILPSPAVTYGDGNVRWEQVQGSSGYEIKIVKGDDVHTEVVGAETFTYKYDFKDAGDYLVYVKANTLGTGGIYGSKYSQPYPVKRLATPTNKIVSNRPLEQNQVSVSFTKSAGADHYVLLADGTEIASITKGNTFTIDLSKKMNKVEEAVVNFKIIAKGGITSEKAVLDCNVPLEFNVTKLATPQNLAISGAQIEWDAVNKTSKYILTIDGKRTEVTTTSYTFTDLAEGDHSIYVQAMGNGEEIITGSFSNALDVTKLATPTNLQIVNGNMTWNKVQGATAYKVKLGTTTYNADTAAFNILNRLGSITEGVGTPISIYAIGNGTNLIDSDVSATKTISKYQRPTNVKLSGDNLVWNPSSVDSINCNDYKLIIKDEDGKIVEKNLTGSSYSLDNFVAGRYTVKVVAIGDMVKTLDSPESDAFTFTKLQNISAINTSGNKYVWDAVPNANGYEIKLSKDATWTVVKTNEYTPTFTTEGKFEVSVRAIGDYANIANSDITTKTQQVMRVTQPVRDDTLTNKNAFKIETVGNTITVTIKKVAVENATYKLIVDGIDRSETSAYDDSAADVVVYEYTMTTQGASYAVQVQIGANGFDASGKYMLDSNLSVEHEVMYN